MKLSVIIPAHNEEGEIGNILEILYKDLSQAKIPHELLVINDNSTDQTEDVLKKKQKTISTLTYVNNTFPNGFGLAVRRGLEAFTGDAAAVFMADGSDTTKDLIAFYNEMLSKKVECVFGTRFSSSSVVTDYPIFKLILNRAANILIQILFGLRYNDVTNAFKLFHRNAIEGAKPFLSHHFNLTVELPLKAIVRGYSYSVVPNDWIGRRHGVSKFKIKEFGSRYLFIILYCFIEKWLSRGDYERVKPISIALKTTEQKRKAQ